MADRGGRAARGAGRGAGRGAARGAGPSSRKRARPGEAKVHHVPRTGILHPHALLQFPEGSDRYRYLDRILDTPVYEARTIDWGLMGAMGVADRLRETFRGPWRTLTEVPTQQYHELILEFFSTCSIDTDASLDTAGSVRFTLGGTDYSFSMREFSWRSGLYTREEVDLAPFQTLLQGYTSGDAPLRVQKGQLAEFWLTIGDGQWGPGAKSTRIRDPYVRYIHRVIGGTIWSRYHGNDKVTEIDLYILYCLLTPVEANAAYILGVYLNHDRKSAARLCGGSYVTMLARQLRTFDAHPAESLSAVEPAVVPISWSDLDNMEIVIHVDGQPRFREPRPLVPVQPVPVVEGQEVPEGQGPQVGQVQPPPPRSRRRQHAPRTEPEPEPEPVTMTQMMTEIREQRRLIELIMDRMEIPFPTDIPRRGGSGSGGVSGSASGS